MPSVLLTGATGFVGRSCVAPLLRRGFEVHAVARTAAALGPGVKTHRADILDPDAVSDLVERVRPTHLLHLAWIATPGVYWTSPANAEWVYASIHLVREFQACGGARAVLAGSCAEYDWSGGTCQESATPLRPTSPYGEAKHALHQLVAELAEHVGLSYAWARLFFLYGPNEHPRRLVPTVIRAILDGREAACSEGSQRRDFLHVADAAEALTLLLGADDQGPINLGTGQATAVRDIVSYLAQTLDAPDRIRWGPAVDEAPLVVADATRLRARLGFLPRFDWRSGLSDVVGWWRMQYARAA